MYIGDNVQLKGKHATVVDSTSSPRVMYRYPQRKDDYVPILLDESPNESGEPYYYGAYCKWLELIHPRDPMWEV